MLNTLSVDNDDTFTYNLHALLTAVNITEPTAIRSDSPWDAIDFDLFAIALYGALRHSGQRVNRFGQIAGLELLFQAASQPVCRVLLLGQRQLRRRRPTLMP